MKMRALLIPVTLLTVHLSGCLEGHDDDPFHRDITVTVFWIGEEGNEENGFIPNLQSAWDDKWMEHYGGVDDPNHRNGSHPADLTPKENPFYFALPYNDLDDDGIRRANANDVVPWSDELTWNASESMCKNRWIEIIKDERVCYAQWEDAGPFGEDDASYVFGNSPPKNRINDNAGLDVSPAVRDHLDLEDIDRVDWRFVDQNDVPEGPWKAIITHSQVFWE